MQREALHDHSFPYNQEESIDNAVGHLVDCPAL